MHVVGVSHWSIARFACVAHHEIITLAISDSLFNLLCCFVFLSSFIVVYKIHQLPGDMVLCLWCLLCDFNFVNWLGLRNRFISLCNRLLSSEGLSFGMRRRPWKNNITVFSPVYQWVPVKPNLLKFLNFYLRLWERKNQWHRSDNQNYSNSKV